MIFNKCAVSKMKGWLGGFVIKIIMLFIIYAFTITEWTWFNFFKSICSENEIPIMHHFKLFVISHEIKRFGKIFHKS